MRVDLNADVGESFGRWTLGDDAALLGSITSANIACGFHAGDPGVMRATIRAARDAGVAIGAHPGFPDLAGFGRRNLAATPEEVEDLVLYQVAALGGMAAAEGTRLRHVKVHGALYGMASRDRSIADAVARAIQAFDATLWLFAPPGSELAHAGQSAGLPVAAEGFADRSYDDDGALAPRSEPGAVIEDSQQAVAQALTMVREGRVLSRSGRTFTIRVDTICTHGDGPAAVRLVRQLRSALAAAGIRVAAPGEAAR